MRKITALTLGIVIVVCASCCSTKETTASSKQAKSENIENKVDTVKNIIPQEMTNILLKTSMGDITIALYNETPLHRDNFIKLVEEKFYDGLLFHRVIQNFMIQGGDPNSKDAPAGKALGNGGPGYTIPAEINTTCYHKRGALAAARLGGPQNPMKESSGSQFYIVDGTRYSEIDIRNFAARANKTYTEEQIITYVTKGGAPHLDGDYTVFGEVIDGMKIVDKIAASAKDQRDRPKEDVKIIEATIVEKEKE